MPQLAGVLSRIDHHINDLVDRTIQDPLPLFEQHAGVGVLNQYALQILPSPTEHILWRHE